MFMTDLRYSDQVMEHFLNPKNMGEIESPDGEATVGNPVCGDVMRLTIKVEKINGIEYVKDVKFKTLGCAAAISTSSAVTEMAKGKSLNEALEITNKRVAEILGGLPKTKMHCSVLAEEALQKAIEDYRQKDKSR